MKNLIESSVVTVCVGCGGSHKDESDTIWLRQDQDRGLGVCSDCRYCLAAWDSGQRDVRHYAKGGDPEQCLPSDQLERLLANANLPSLPLVLLEIYDALSSETAGVDQIARLLETDAGLSARALRLGNSAFYGLKRKITTVTEVIVRVGPFDLWWLLFTTEVKSLFFGVDRQLMDMEHFWRHSLFVACASRCLSERFCIGRPEELFVVGLLHDIGKLLMLQRIPVEYGEILQRVAEGDSLLATEGSVLGFTHADIGARLLEHWNLPKSLVEGVKTHHVVSSELSGITAVWAADNLVHHLLDGETLSDLAELQDERLVGECTGMYEHLVALVL